ncbi:hypothetical protein [Streptomyces sp. NPDC001315]|uniref:hypothetical protein n=1 Tax=Streptomyces sp. NPDC001315 TaxID=3364562 RepID=UPI0036811D35
MLLVAVLLLPLLSVLLIVMDRVEDRLLDPTPSKRRHAAGRRPLRLVRGGHRDAAPGPAPEADTETPPAPRAA